MPLHIDTPLIESRPLGFVTDRSCWLKLEAIQPSGSFKLRGVGVACETYAARGARRLISSSGGNAGIAVAYAGRHLAVAVTIVVPESTTERAKALIRQEGAELLVHGASWQEANALAHSLVGEEDAFLHPFDDPLVWEGHATLVDEVARRGPKPGVVVLSVGGGGLFCGIVEGLRRNDWADVPIVCVETEGAASLAQSLAAGDRVLLPAITSIATSLGAKQICEQAFAYAREHPVRSVVVSDLTAVRACQRFLEDHRILVEPACGAALAVGYENLLECSELEPVLFVVCGGVTATLAQLQRWSGQLEQFNPVAP